jgi:hypothetical protein
LVYKKEKIKMDDQAKFEKWFDELNPDKKEIIMQFVHVAQQTLDAIASLVLEEAMKGNNIKDYVLKIDLYKNARRIAGARTEAIKGV